MEGHHCPPHPKTNATADTHRRAHTRDKARKMKKFAGDGLLECTPDHSTQQGRRRSLVGIGIGGGVMIALMLATIMLAQHSMDDTTTHTHHTSTKIGQH